VFLLEVREHPLSAVNGPKHRRLVPSESQ
jgi:hypothetical protein